VVNQRADIVLSDEEVADFLAGSRSMTLATVGPTGQPHLVAMWFAIIDGSICFETKAKSQKAVNLRRNPQVSALIEDGVVYEDLRGVAIEGVAAVTDDAELLWRIGVNLFERYYGPYTDDLKPFVEIMLKNRVAVRLTNQRVRSWDHRKLALPSTGEPAGTTMAVAGRRAR
jgi:PPOX class probable F420-dependent enzyme